MPIAGEEWSLPLRELLGSVLLIVLLTAVRVAFERYLRSQDSFLSHSRRRVLSNVKNAILFLILVGLALIWAPALRTFALSLTAFLVAIIFATKELILCLSGGFLRASTGAVRVGDWVDINGIHGEVVHQDLFTMHIQEIPGDGRSYDYTGRTVTVPNSLLLTAAIKNENFFNKYVYHQFQIVFDADIDHRAVEKAVIDSLNAQMAEHRELAARYNLVIEKKAGVDLQDIDPRANLDITNEGRARIRFSAFMPTRFAVKFEQEAIRAGLDCILAAKEAKAAAKGA